MENPSPNLVLRAACCLVAWGCLVAAAPPIRGAAEGAPGDSPPDENRAEAVAFFETTIRPLLAERCFDCHGADTQEADLRVDCPDQLFDANRTPPLIAPGDPDGSRLVHLVRGTRELQMPPDDPLSPDEIRSVEHWVSQGAVWPGYDAQAVRSVAQSESDPTAAEFTEEQRNYWAFQPVRDPAIPDTRDRDWPANDIDRFILARLEAKGLRPARRAEKGLLLRRVTFDLTGLPPTPDEMASFLADNSPDAFARVVDRLLASPHYGERWGQHWLDVARFAESGGHDGNEAYLLAWRYRDYVIKAFNDDMPYDQFIIEQLAGDLCNKTGNTNRDFAQVVATGFLQVGAKPSVMRDKQQMLLDITDEQINATGVAFLGLTLACARCHDHKFDPIPTADYYSLAGIFMSTQVMADTEVNSKWLEFDAPIDDDGADDVAKVMAVCESAEPKNLRVHIRGNYRTLGPEAPRRFLQILCGPEAPELQGSGRLELARWIAGPEHPLTARVMVNRIWQHHFGRGLVATSGNFGRMGSTPTHPELLDWLASRFVENGWSVKAMHRLILLSSAYQQAGEVDDAALAADPESELIGRMRPRRLAAEELRDSLLAVSGQLDDRSGGTLFREGYIPIDEKRNLFTVAIPGQSEFAPFSRPCRSVYLPVIRNARPEILKLFDAANEHEPSAVRSETTVPPQALFLLNSHFVSEASAALAKRLLDDVGPFIMENTAARPSQMIDRLFQLVLARSPSQDETTQFLTFIDNYARAVAADPADPAVKATWDLRPQLAKRKPSAVPPPDLPQFLAWQAACRTLLCSNEFMYVQ